MELGCSAHVLILVIKDVFAQVNYAKESLGLGDEVMSRGVLKKYPNTR